MIRTLDHLIAEEDDAWPQILAWVGAAVRRVEILPVDSAGRGEATLLALQVTTRSPMGSIALRSGGVLVDGGWLRILGAGHERLGGGLREWNGLDGNAPLDPALSGALIVAYDAVGGFFALNGGAWEGTLGHVHYFAPDTYERESLNLTYSGLLDFAFSGDLDSFYRQSRWSGWENDVAGLGPDEAIAIYPFLGFKGDPIESRSRRPVPARELWGLYRSMGSGLGGIPNAAEIRVQIANAPPGDIPPR